MEQPPGARVVAIGTWIACAGAVHAALNAMLMRRAPQVLIRRSGISVLIPARDEQANIADCLASVTGQGASEILVLDDASADSTLQIALRAAERDALIRVLTGAPLPPGWLGKPFACAQLAEAADASSDVLVFIDADVRLEPGALQRAVAVLDDLRLDLVSPHPRQCAESAAERLIQPLLQWSILTFLPLRLAQRCPSPALSAANGQFLVVRRERYQSCGGHGAIRNEILDDLALMRRVKAAGGSGALIDGTPLAHCRMYHGWRPLRDGYTKSLGQAAGSGAGWAVALALLAVAYLAPPLAALRGSRTGLLGVAAGVAGRLISARATGARPLTDAFAHPVSIVVLEYLVLRSRVMRRRGTATWKGRRV
ncbi:MAG: glycosyltransferase [Actinomycetota bacterium]|nr:glycosyltransferase [Actinomycetota bacterium]